MHARGVAAGSGAPGAELKFESIRARNLRNIRELAFEPAAKLNVIAGDNGQGKTSVLEAIYWVATSRSFRTDNLRELIQQGTEQASVSARVREGRELREQRAVIGSRGRSYVIDTKRPRRIADYALRTPVVVFHPGDLALSSGPASERRTLLDRVALFLQPSSGDDRVRYTRALRERQRILDERGIGAPDLEAFEQIAAEYGSRLQQARALAAAEIRAQLGPAFTKIATPGLALLAEYQPGGSEDSAEFAHMLATRRTTDLHRGSASFGPQRDELALSIDGRPARFHASQGQQRILALALKLAELVCIQSARGASPVLLLDDVSSELDPSRTGAVHEFLRQGEGQIFVTTTRPELFAAEAVPGLGPRERADWTLQSGVLGKPEKA